MYAYRILGFASRQCLEIGLHRRQTLMDAFPNEEERSWALKLFWSIYVLDRRWSFGTGMPFALQDADIDPQLPEPVSAVASSVEAPDADVIRIIRLTWQPWSNTVVFRLRSGKLLQILRVQIARSTRITSMSWIFKYCIGTTTFPQA